VLTKSLDSISTDHFTLLQNFHSIEILDVLEPIMLLLLDGNSTIEINNGSLMESQRPLEITTGNLTLLISNPTVDQAMSDVPLPTQDGGRSSDMKVDISSMIKEKLLKFKTKALHLIKKTETLWLATEEVISDNNGRSSMSMNTRNQERVN
jgi:hypothetical protein